MRLLISIYQDEDGVYIAECPSIPGCVSQGMSETEALTSRNDQRHAFFCTDRQALTDRVREIGVPV